jgi:predicted deacetylase
VSAPATSSSFERARALSVLPGAAARASRSLCISLHDVAPATWTACERVLEAVAAAAVGSTSVGPSVPRVPVALLIVPRYRGVDSARDRNFLRAIEARAAAGDELVLHGYTHVDEQPPRGWGLPFDLLRRRVYTAGEGEFSALARDEALRRIELGLAWFAARGWPVSGFVAPAWLMSSAARAALYDTALDYASTRAELLLLPSREALMAPSLVYSTRSAWRRRASLQFNRVLAAVNQHRELLRLALHPADAQHGEVRASWQELLRAALSTRSVRTEGALVAERLAAGAAPPVLAG